MVLLIKVKVFDTSSGSKNSLQPLANKVYENDKPLTASKAMSVEMQMNRGIKATSKFRNLTRTN